MARRGLTPPDTSGYGFYNVRLREGLRQYLLPDTATLDTTAFDDDDQAPTIEMQDDAKSLFDRIFGGKNKDTTNKQTVKTDTVQKTKKQLRQERREQRQREKEQEEKNNSSR